MPAPILTEFTHTHTHTPTDSSTNTLKPTLYNHRYIIIFKVNKKQKIHTKRNSNADDSVETEPKTQFDCDAMCDDDNCVNALFALYLTGFCYCVMRFVIVM